MLSLLFPYYSLVAHNISLVALDLIYLLWSLFVYTLAIYQSLFFAPLCFYSLSSRSPYPLFYPRSSLVFLIVIFIAHLYFFLLFVLLLLAFIARFSRYVIFSLLFLSFIAHFIRSSLLYAFLLWFIIARHYVPRFYYFVCHLYIFLSFALISCSYCYYYVLFPYYSVNNISLVALILVYSCLSILSFILFPHYCNSLILILSLTYRSLFSLFLSYRRSFHSLIYYSLYRSSLARRCQLLFLSLSLIVRSSLPLCFYYRSRSSIYRFSITTGFYGFGFIVRSSLTFVVSYCYVLRLSFASRLLYIILSAILLVALCSLLSSRYLLYPYNRNKTKRNLTILSSSIFLFLLELY